MIDTSYDRPDARIDDDGNLVVRVSASSKCRRALWYSLTGAEKLPYDEQTLMYFATGQALESVVLEAMQRNKWAITESTGQVNLESGELADGLWVEGRFDAYAMNPDYEYYIVEVKTRNHDAYRRWQHYGVEISHPEAARQAALYSMLVSDRCMIPTMPYAIACMDVAERCWDVEEVPAERVMPRVEEARAWLTPLRDWWAEHGAELPPPHDHGAYSWECKDCPFRQVCRPNFNYAAEKAETLLPVTDRPPITETAASIALQQYEAAHAREKEASDIKSAARAVLSGYLAQKGETRTVIQGSEGERTVYMARGSLTYTVNHKRLLELLPPEQRAEVLKESRGSESLRVS